MTNFEQKVLRVGMWVNGGITLVLTLVLWYRVWLRRPWSEVVSDPDWEPAAALAGSLVFAPFAFLLLSFALAALVGALFVGRVAAGSVMRWAGGRE